MSVARRVPSRAGRVGAALGTRRPRWRLAGRAVAALVALALAALAVALAARPAPVAAHANLESAEPAPDAAVATAPARVVIRFTEPLAPALSAIEVLDASGQRVDRNDSAVDAADAHRMLVSVRPLPPGTYTVFWRNVSTVDGHALRGTYVFYVGERPAGAPVSSVQEPPLFTSPGDPVVRWLVLAGGLAAMGALLFQLAVAAPAAARAAREAGAAAEAIERRVRRVAAGGLALFAGASLAHLVLQAASGGDVGLPGALGAPLRHLLGGTDWGRLWLARAALTAAAAVALLPWLRAAGGGQLWRASLPAGLALVAAALGTLSLASHAAATPNVAPLATAADLVHLLAAGAWAGALVPMALAVHAARGVTSTQPRRSLLRSLATRFSVLALLSTAALALTGLYGAWAQIVAWSALDTPYGRIVLAKVALLVVLLALGALNLRVLSPRLAGDDGAARRLGLVVRLEVALVVGAVLAAALLTSIEPARQAAGRAAVADGIRFEERVEGTRIALAIRPGTTGTNRVVVDLADARGRPVIDATYVGLRVQFAEADLGARTLAATHERDGRYRSEEVVLGIGGRWQAEVEVSRPDALDARTAFRFDVAAPGAAAGGRFEPDAETGRLAWSWQVILLGGLLLAVSHAWWRRTRAGRAATTLGAATAAAGVVLGLGLGHLHTEPAPGGALVNPFPPNPASLAAGRKVFATTCVPCHGTGGLGDGPNAAALNPRPANLVAHVPMHSDGELVQMVANGFPRTGMPAFRGRLSDEELWHLVNFLRTLDGAGAPATGAGGTGGR